MGIRDGDAWYRRRLVVVAREEHDLYRYILHDFYDDPTTEVVVDRRFGERRQRAISGLVDRRKSERRRVDIGSLLDAYGYAIVYNPPRRRGEEQRGRADR